MSKVFQNTLLEHSAILLTCIKLPSVLEIFVLSIFKWPLKTGLTICSKISNTFLFLFSNKRLVFRPGIHKRFVRIANREDPDQTASSGNVV